MVLVVKSPLASAGDAGSIPGLGRSPGEGNGNPFQYSCLGNPMDRGAWWATVNEFTESDTTEHTQISLVSGLNILLVFLFAKNNIHIFSYFLDFFLLKSKYYNFYIASFHLKTHILKITSYQFINCLLISLYRCIYCIM